MLYKITYFVDAERTKIDEKIEETTETLGQLLGHSHVIEAIQIEERPKVVEDKKVVVKTKKSK